MWIVDEADGIPVDTVSAKNSQSKDQSEYRYITIYTTYRQIKLNHIESCLCNCIVQRPLQGID